MGGFSVNKQPLLQPRRLTTLTPMDQQVGATAAVALHLGVACNCLKCRGRVTVPAVALHARCGHYSHANIGHG
jgi:hypothetical protein